jgi:uncharacterized iron-regulated membrane protein
MLKTKTWFRIHSFTGVITGLMLFVICWSGTFAVISHELDWLVTPEARTARAVDGPIDWHRLYQQVRSVYPNAQVAWMEKPLYQRAAVQYVVNMPDQDYVRIYLDPQSAKILGRSSYFTVQRFFRSFHMYLFLPMQVGSYIVMAFSLTLLLSLAAGLLFYKRWWTRFFRFRAGKTAFWSELHKTVGLWSLWFVLLISLTGVWYLFELMRSHMGDGIMMFSGEGAYAKNEIPKPNSPSDLSSLPLSALIAIAQEQRPDLDIRTISFEYDECGSDACNTIKKVYFDGQSEHWLVRNRANQLHLDARTGEVLYDQRAHNYPLYWRWSDTADPLHFGNFGGLISKFVWFFFGLLLSGLILTGTWLHARRLARETNGRNRWPGTGAAIVVSCGILAASVPFGFIEAKEHYGSLHAGVKQLPTLASGVKCFVSAWTATTLLMIAAWAFLVKRTVEHGAESGPSSGK